MNEFNKIKQMKFKNIKITLIKKLFKQKKFRFQNYQKKFKIK